MLPVGPVVSGSICMGSLAAGMKHYSALCSAQKSTGLKFASNDYHNDDT